MKNYCLVFLSCLLLCGCTESRLEYALRASGENRGELEKVLSHYSQKPEDDLKLKAAIFLIENMPGHYGYYGPEMDSYKQWIDSAAAGYDYLIRRALYYSLYKQPQIMAELEVREDIKIITADYLIRNIERSFEIWNTYPWCADVSFDDFCEYILPYRIYNEPLDYWKDVVILPKREIEYYEYFDSKFDLITLYNDIYKRYFSKTPVSRTGIILPDGNKIVTDCMETAIAEVASYRNLGIPATIDFFAQSFHRDGRHSMPAIIDSKLNHVPQRGTEIQRATKVLRRTYSHNATPADIIMYAGILNDPFFKDVTDMYMNCEDVVLKIPRKLRSKTGTAYLASFNSQNWEPSWWADIEASRAVFKNMATHNIYLPLAYRNHSPIYIDYPFYLSGSGRRVFKPDTEHPTDIAVTKKSPAEFFRKWYWQQGLENSYIEASDSPDFKNAVKVGRLTYNPYMKPYSIEITTDKQYRYWRYVTLHKNGYVGELKIFDKKGSPIDPSDISLPNENPSAQLMFDGDELTYYTFFKGSCEFDFKKPVGISSFRFSPRRDGNDVTAGNIYELYYWDMDGWRSHAREVAQGDTLYFENVPSGALYLLKCHTEGREERIFTCDHNGIRFW